MRMPDLYDALPWVFGGFFLTGVCFVGLVIGTFAAGAYSYEYRCTDNVVEKRLSVWDLTTVGGFEPIDGDPVGACDE